MKYLMKNFTKKLASIAILVTVLSTLALAIIPANHNSENTKIEHTAYAEDTAPAADPAAPKDKSGTGGMSLKNLKDLTFPVQDYLKLPGDNQAQSYFDTENSEAANQTRFPLIKFILDAIDTMTKIAGTIAVTLLIVTGFIMIFSQGSQTAIEKAKQMFTYELIGIIVILLSYVMVTLVQGLLTTS